MKDKKALGSQRPPQASNPASKTLRFAQGDKAYLEQQVVRAQKQISLASQRGDKQAIYTLQQRLMESEAARLLAVRRVTGENQGKDTAGVDGVKSLTAKERLAMASAIHPKNWNQQPPRPVRRVWVPKPGTTERRPLAILTMMDRCKQALVKLALEPEWEARFEPHSYGYRPGRSSRDAITAILAAIDRHPRFVFDADIEGAFDNLSQAVVLDKLQTFPALRQAINAWLRAGVMDGTTYFSSEKGIAQGGVLSPLLMNVALHGMEAVVGNEPLLVRYADDFVILHTDLNELQRTVKRVKQWLATMGLHLHAHKTRITHTLTPYQGRVGFDFLGFNICQEAVERGDHGRGGRDHGRGGRDHGRGKPRPYGQEYLPGVKTIITPSQEASKRHLAAIEQRLQQLQIASQAQIIAELNPLILGWANYYTGIVEALTMSRYDDLMEQRLISWASRRHPGKARDWLLSHYWHRAGQHRKVFATDDGLQLRGYQQTRILGGR
jgi:RNA-directed DNA polymerase